MRKTTKVTGTKIAQAAKDLNVTSVTIRRYISEFNIETATDENGIKVLPPKAMDELQVIRKHKEDGLTNPKVLEELEAIRSKGGGKSKAAAAEKEDEEEKEPAKPVRRASRIESKPTPVKKGRGRAVVEEVEEEEEEEEVEEAPAAKRGVKRRTKAEPVEQEAEAEEEESSDEERGESGESDAGADGRPKHSLTCQTCGKSFEHMNPRLRDCLDCYRAKRKERRRGGDRHKNVIQHPLAQQVASKMASQKENGTAEPAASAPAERGERVERSERSERGERPERGERGDRQSYAPTRTAAPRREERTQLQAHSASSTAQPVIGGLKTKVRSYRKAIEETRNITGSLKRRLERPDLPEGDRRWLEQIYAYQLILHQGWRHLSEYKSATPKSGDDK